MVPKVISPYAVHLNDVSFLGFWGRRVDHDLELIWSDLNYSFSEVVSHNFPCSNAKCELLRFKCDLNVCRVSRLPQNDLYMGSIIVVLVLFNDHVVHVYFKHVHYPVLEDFVHNSMM